MRAEPWEGFCPLRSGETSSPDTAQQELRELEGAPPGGSTRGCQDQPGMGFWPSNAQPDASHKAGRSQLPQHPLGG